MWFCFEKLVGLLFRGFAHGSLKSPVAAVPWLYGSLQNRGPQHRSQHNMVVSMGAPHPEGVPKL